MLKSTFFANNFKGFKLISTPSAIKKSFSLSVVSILLFPNLIPVKLIPSILPNLTGRER